MTQEQQVSFVADIVYLYMALSMVDDDQTYLEKNEAWACVEEWGELVQADSSALHKGWDRAQDRIAEHGCTGTMLDACVKAMSNLDSEILGILLNDFVRIAIVDGRIYENEKDFCNWVARSFRLPEPFDYELSPGAKYAIVRPG